LSQWGIINRGVSSFNGINNVGEREAMFPVLPPFGHSAAVHFLSNNENNNNDKRRKKRAVLLHGKGAGEHGGYQRRRRPIQLLHDPSKSRLGEGGYGSSSAVVDDEVCEVCLGPNIMMKTQGGGGVSSKRVLHESKKKSSSSDARRLIEERPRCVVTGKFCKKDRYIARQDPSYVLSPEAFHNGEFPAFLCAEDFLRETQEGQLSHHHDSPARPLGGEAELALLEAVKSYGGDFESISDHAQMPSREHAMLHFLRLPLMDAFSFADKDRLLLLIESPKKNQKKTKNSNNKKMKNRKKKQSAAVKGGRGTGAIVDENDSNDTAGCDDGGTNVQKLPFLERVPNPLMAQLAVISSKVSPHVSAAMAKEALMQYGLIEQNCLLSCDGSGVKREKEEEEERGELRLTTSSSSVLNSSAASSKVGAMKDDAPADSRSRTTTVVTKQQQQEGEEEEEKQHSEQQSKEGMEEKKIPSTAAAAAAAAPTTPVMKKEKAERGKEEVQSKSSSTTRSSGEGGQRDNNDNNDYNSFKRLMARESDYGKMILEKALKKGTEKAMELAAEELRQERLIMRLMCKSVLHRIRIKMAALNRQLDSWAKNELDHIKKANIGLAKELSAMSPP